MENAVPTALGRWLAIVLVWGGIFSGLLPMTLWRPPLMGSSEDAIKDRAISYIGVASGICFDLSMKKGPLR